MAMVQLADWLHAQLVEELEDERVKFDYPTITFFVNQAVKAKLNEIRNEKDMIEAGMSKVVCRTCGYTYFDDGASENVKHQVCDRCARS